MQIHDLRDRVRDYNGLVALLPLKTKLSLEQEKSMNRWVWEVYNLQVSYDYLQIIDAGIDFFDKYGVQAKSDDSSLFCSEFAVKALQVAGIINRQINSAEVVPGDFLKKFNCFKKSVTLKTFAAK
ncbi:MAG: hypothetical protein F6J93_25730 [Oscillatoria sp. SIO1A7]|nr:hypothetical protein [Oscillatoria sp. SIO1A7]